MSDNYEMEAGDISVFYNDDTAGTKKPQFTGEIVLPSGEVQRVALWPWESKTGKRGLSGKYEPKREAQPTTEEAVTTPASDLPW